MSSSPKKTRKRPRKRVLVRWDENLDELLLLTIQSVCNSSSVKIPWFKVAETMGQNVSEGAIVQHLAKIRSRRVAAGKTVPPPLRRGGGGVNKKPKPAKGKAAGRSRARKIKEESDDDSEVEMAVVDTDSGSEYGVKPKRVSARKSKVEVSAAESDESTDTDADGESINTDDGDELVAKGASFLSYPNFKSGTTTPCEKSKLVVLKYNPKAQPTAQHTGAEQSTSYAGDSTDVLNWIPNPTYGAPFQTGNAGDPNAADYIGVEQSTGSAGDSTNILNWIPHSTYGNPHQGFTNPTPAVPKDTLGIDPSPPTYDPSVYAAAASGMATLDALRQRDPSNMPSPWPYDSWDSLVNSDRYPVFHDDGNFAHFVTSADDMSQVGFITPQPQGSNADASHNP